MKNFYVALTYGDVPPGQKFRFNEYFEKDVDWGNCVRVCIDGAASMTAYRLGVVKKITK